MREPEFLPEWYHLRLRRSRRRLAVIRATVALSLATAMGIAVTPGQAPAVVAEALEASARTHTTAPSRPRLPAGMRHALRAVDQATPAGVVVSELAFSRKGDVTLVDIECVVDDEAAANRFASALRQSHTFRDVQINHAPAATRVAAGSVPVAISPVHRPETALDPSAARVTLHVRLTLVSAGSR